MSDKKIEELENRIKELEKNVVEKESFLKDREVEREFLLTTILQLRTFVFKGEEEEAAYNMLIESIDPTTAEGKILIRMSQIFEYIVLGSHLILTEYFVDPDSEEMEEMVKVMKEKIKDKFDEKEDRDNGNVTDINSFMKKKGSDDETTH